LYVPGVRRRCFAGVTAGGVAGGEILNKSSASPFRSKYIPNR
jgi:hypothetical protein